MLILWGCEFHRMNIGSDMTKMPVLDTCTEITANLLKLPGGRGGKIQITNINRVTSISFQSTFRRSIMLLPMWKQQRVVFLS